MTHDEVWNQLGIRRTDRGPITNEQYQRCSICNVACCPGGRRVAISFGLLPRVARLDSMKVREFLHVRKSVLREIDMPRLNEHGWLMPHQLLFAPSLTVSWPCVGFWRFMTTILRAAALKRIKRVGAEGLDEFLERLETFESVLDEVSEAAPKQGTLLWGEVAPGEGFD